MVTDLDNFELLIQALDFWVQDSVVPVQHKWRDSWTTQYLCLTKDWRYKYNHFRQLALCELVIDHYGSICIDKGSEKELVNNYKYLYHWLIGKESREQALLQYLIRRVRVK